MLNHLLANFNDGRRKNFFCVAVNLLELVMYDYQKNNMRTLGEVLRSYHEHLELLKALERGVFFSSLEEIESRK